MSSQPFDPPTAPPTPGRLATFRVQLGERPRPLTAGLAALTGFSFPAFQFGRRCFCCSADTHGETVDYDASTDRHRIPTIPVPVCAACKPHAKASNIAIEAGVPFLMASLAGVALAIMYLRERPEDSFLWGMLAVCSLLSMGIAAWFWATHRRNKELAHAGHHADFSILVGSGVISFITTNRKFADELVTLNPGAKLL